MSSFETLGLTGGATAHWARCVSSVCLLTTHWAVHAHTIFRRYMMLWPLGITHWAMMCRRHKDGVGAGRTWLCQLGFEAINVSCPRCGWGIPTMVVPGVADMSDLHALGSGSLQPNRRSTGTSAAARCLHTAAYSRTRCCGSLRQAIPARWMPRYWLKSIGACRGSSHILWVWQAAHFNSTMRSTFMLDISPSDRTWLRACWYSNRQPRLWLSFNNLHRALVASLVRAYGTSAACLQGVTRLL